MVAQDDAYYDDDPFEYAGDEDEYRDIPPRAPAPPPRRGGRAGGYGFPVFVGIVALLGVLIVWRQRDGRDAASVPTGTEQGDANPVDLSQGRRMTPAPVAPMRRDLDPARVNNLYNRSRRLVEFAAPLGPARPGEWRTLTQEPAQTYYQFARDPQRPAFPAHARTIVLQPFSDLSPSGRAMLPLLQDFLARFFDMPVRLAPPLPTASLPAEAWRTDKRGERQLNAEYTLERVLAPRRPPDGAIMVGVTGFDLHPGGRWEYENAYGWASFYGRAALVSLSRSFPGNDRREATMQDFVHLLKFAAHETIHALGLKHCARYACLVNGRATLQENAAKPLWLCPDCYAKTALATGFDDGRRARRLAAFCHGQGMTAERDYWTNLGMQMR